MSANCRDCGAPLGKLHVLTCPRRHHDGNTEVPVQPIDLEITSLDSQRQAVLDAARRMRSALPDDPAIGSEELAQDIEVVTTWLLGDR